MPLFQQSQKERFTPTELKLSHVYKTATGGSGKLTGSIIEKAGEAMKQAGFTEGQVRSILYKNQAIPVSEMKKVATVMNKAGIYGFSKDPKFIIEKYLNKERVKAQSIAGIRKEHILEAAEENLVNYGNTSLSQKGISPNAPKPGEASVSSRRHTHSNASYSLSSRTNSKPSSSLSGKGGSASSLGRPTGSGRISAKPGF